MERLRLWLIQRSAPNVSLVCYVYAVLNFENQTPVLGILGLTVGFVFTLAHDPREEDNYKLMLENNMLRQKLTKLQNGIGTNDFEENKDD